MSPKSSLLVVSPHLDDGVLSCGARLSVADVAVVLTVFAGGRADWSTPTEWDARCGFGPGVDVIAARRIEDRSALRRLGATPHWLESPEVAYRTEPFEGEAGAEAIAACISELGPDEVFIPLGLGHPDHRLTSKACLLVTDRFAERRFMVYAEVPYALDRPDEVGARLRDIQAMGYSLRPVPSPGGSRVRKAAALASYQSQRRGLGTRAVARCALSAERYWALEVR